MAQALSISHDEYYDLGTHHMPVSTRSPEVQKWFDRGLVWAYGFNHEESVRCFEKAAEGDPDCAMAYWGIAYSLGPNYNKPWEFFDSDELGTTLARAHRATAQAMELAIAPEETSDTKVEPVERALIQALQSRYPKDNPDKACGAWNRAYAEAMGEVHRQFPDDLNVTTIYVDALMNMNPWKLWDIRTGEPAPNARTLEAKEVLERALSRDAYHPGLLHLYIHLMEMSGYPEQALPMADQLRNLVPDAGHLQHMPTHLDILCGDYARAIESNTAAVVADERFLARAGPLNFYSLYRCHDYHFCVYAAMFAGKARVALDMAAQLETSLPADLLRVPSPPMADWLEGFLAVRAHVLVRFGKWREILELALPQDRELYCVTTATLHYAKGVALAVLGRVDEAEAQRGLMREAVKRVPTSRTLFNNTCRDILDVASAMLDGELAYRRACLLSADDGSTKDSVFDAAFARLWHAVALDDGLPYDEPWGWMQPTRHSLGALLLESGRVADAAAVYAADLGLDFDGTPALPRALQHRGNVWALHGFHECLVRLGRETEAREVEPKLRHALEVADVPIQASCFCRVGSAGGDGARRCCSGSD